MSKVPIPRAHEQRPPASDKIKVPTHHAHARGSCATGASRVPCGFYLGTGARATAERVSDLEALEAVAALGLLADDVKHRVDELSTLGVC